MVEDSDKNHVLSILKDNPLKTPGIYDVIAFFSAQKLNKVIKGRIRHHVRHAEKKSILNSKRSLQIFAYFLSDHENLKSWFTSAPKKNLVGTL